MAQSDANVPDPGGNPLGEKPDRQTTGLSFFGSAQDSEVKLAQAPTHSQPSVRPSSHNAKNEYGSLGELDEDFTTKTSIWKLYETEARKQDGEFVGGRDKNLDTMLVFAGLYSGVLTAFLIDSTALLQRDPAEITNGLLLTIAQSQWRMETGNVNASLPPVQLPIYEVSVAARVVNCLWFMALVLSLGAAMVAMLAKEWLSTFIAYETRDPHEFSQQRQSRYDSFKSWHATAVIDFIPTLLHFSLLLFMLGLIVQLWLIDSVVAIVITAASIITTILYVSAVLLGASIKYCPYNSRMSEYTRRLYHRLRRTKLIPPIYIEDIARRARIFNPMKAGDWRAVEWLLDHARDRNTVNGAYQWLTNKGLFDMDIQQLMDLNQRAASKKDQLAMMMLGVQATNQLKNSSDQYLDELVFCKGANAARYALILSEVYRYAQQNPALKQSSMHSGVHDIVLGAFETLDKFWGGKLPPFVAGSNADLITAELRLTLYALEPPSGGEESLTARSDASSPGQHRIDLLEPTDLSNLQKRASRVLCRAGLSLHYHVTQEAPLAHVSLVTLLSSLKELVNHSKVRIIAPEDKPGDPNKKIEVRVMIDGTFAKSHYFDHDAIGNNDSILNALVSLLKTSSSMTPLPEDVLFHCASAIAEVAPKLIREWMETHESAPKDYQLTTWPCYNGTFPMNRKFPSQRPILNVNLDLFIVEQLLEITRFAMMHANDSSMRNLPSTALNALLPRIDTFEGREAVFIYFSSPPERLWSWFEAASIASSSSLYNLTHENTTLLKKTMVRVLSCSGQVLSLLPSDINMTSEQEVGTDSKLEPVWGALSQITGAEYMKDVAQLLVDIFTSYYQDDESLAIFTQRKGFSYLLDIGSYDDDNVRARVTDIIIEVVIRLGSPELGSMDQLPRRVPDLKYDQFTHFLRAISFLYGPHSSLDLNKHTYGRSLLPAAILQIIEKQGENNRGIYKRGDVYVELKGLLPKLITTLRAIEDTESTERAESIQKCI